MIQIARLTPHWPIALVLFAWGIFTLGTLGLAPLFDYDETVYAQTALDMMRQGEWIVPTANGMQFFEKPPFVYYLMDISFALFGPSAFAARLPSAIFILLTALLIYRFGCRIRGQSFGFGASLIYLSMLETGLLAHAAILDPVLNFFIAGALFSYFHWLREGGRRHALTTAAMMGLGVSIKGPVGLVIPVLVILIDQLLHRSLKAMLKAVPWWPCLGVLLLTATPWYLMIGIRHGLDFLYEFIMVHNIGRALQPMQGHGGGWHYYLVVFAVSVLPWLPLVPRAFRGLGRTAPDDPLIRLGRLCWIWTLTVMLLFTLAQTKLPHYISSIYPAVALALTASLWRAAPLAAMRIRIAGFLLLLPVALFLLLFPLLYDPLAAMVSHPRAVAVLSQDIRPGLAIPAGGLLLTAGLFWLLRSRRALAAQFIVIGFLLQAALLVPLGSFAGRLAQGPQSEIASRIASLPAKTAVLSLALNAPSISFESGRNFRLLVSIQELEDLRASPFALFLREESEAKLPQWLRQTGPAVRRGGYLLYLHPGDAR